VFLKKSLYEKEAKNPKTGEAVVALRTRLTLAALDLKSLSDEATDLVMSKHINACPNFSKDFEPFEV